MCGAGELWSASLEFVMNAGDTIYQILMTSQQREISWLVLSDYQVHYTAVDVITHY